MLFLLFVMLDLKLFLSASLVAAVECYILQFNESIEIKPHTTCGVRFLLGFQKSLFWPQFGFLITEPTFGLPHIPILNHKSKIAAGRV